VRSNFVEALRAPALIALPLSRVFWTVKPKMHQFDSLELPASADFHVHLRDGDVMETVALTIRQGGVDMVYVCV
jgi:hypothetical protein